MISSKRYRLSDGQTLVSLSLVIVGALSLGSVLVGLAQGSAITPILITTAGGLFATSIWWALSKHYLETWIFGTLAGFNATYALLQLGVTNRWYGIPIQDLANVVSIYLVTWIFLFLVLLIVVVRESKGMAIMLVSIDVGLGIVLTANLLDSLSLLRWAALTMAIVVVVSLSYIARVVLGWRRRDRKQRANANASKAWRGTDPVIGRPTPSGLPAIQAPEPARAQAWILPSMQRTDWSTRTPGDNDAESAS